MERKLFLSTVERLKKQAIFHGLYESQYNELAMIAEHVAFEGGVFIFKEGDLSQQIYLLLQGKVQILKWDKHKTDEFIINELSEGSLFGEMAFVDSEARSTSVKAMNNCQLLLIDNKKLQAHEQLHHAIIKNIAELNIARLRHSNDDYVESLKIQIKEFKLRNEFGRFFITVIVTLGLGDAIDQLVRTYQINVRDAWFNWLYLLLLLLPVCFFIRRFNYPLSMFGITTERWKKSMYEGILLSALLIVLFFSGYMSLNYFHKPASLYPLLALDLPRVFNITFLTYYAHAYLQEFLARGVTQSSLQRFLDDKGGMRAILLTSGIFGIFHLHIGFLMGFLTFSTSLFFGWIYNRTNNLLGVSLVHFVLGACAMSLGLI